MEALHDELQSAARLIDGLRRDLSASEADLAAAVAREQAAAQKIAMLESELHGRFTV